MKTFALIHTGGGSSVTSASFYGPFELPGAYERFAEKVREAIEKLGGSGSVITVAQVPGIPNGWSAIDPDHFQGFMRPDDAPPLTKGETETPTKRW